MNTANRINIVKKDISELHRDMFRRKIIARSLCDEAVEQIHAIEKKIKDSSDISNIIIVSLEKYKEKIRNEIQDELKQKQKELWKNKEKQLEKLAAMFRENHKKIEIEEISQKERLEKEKKESIKEVEEEYNIKAYFLNPFNDPENYIKEIAFEKGIEIGDKNDFDMQLGSKLNDYELNLKIIEEEKNKRIKEIEEHFEKKAKNLEIAFEKFNKKVVDKEIELIRKVVSDYNSSINRLEKEYNEKIENKISEIDKVINSIREKSNANFEILNSEKMKIKKEYEAKLRSLMKSEIPEEFLYKYICCKIETKKIASLTPTNIEMTSQTEKQADDNKDKLTDNSKDENKEEVKSSEVQEFSESKSEVKNKSQSLVEELKIVPNTQNQTHAIFWSYDQEIKKKWNQRIAKISRWIRVTVFSTIAGVLLTQGPLYYLDRRITFKSNVIDEHSEIVIKYADILRKSFLLKREIQKTLDEVRANKKERENKKAVSTESNSIKTDMINETDRNISVSIKEKNLSFNPLSEIDEYDAAKLNLNEQIRIYMSRIEKITRKEEKLLKNINYIASIASKKNLSPYKLNQIASLVRAAYSGVINEKELTDWINYVLIAEEWEIRALNGEFVYKPERKRDLEKTIIELKKRIKNQINTTNESNISEKQVEGKNETQKDAIKMSEEDKVKSDIQFTEEEIPKDAIIQPVIVTDLTNEKETSVTVISDQEELNKIQQNSENIVSDNAVSEAIIKVEELTNHIVMCGDVAKVILAPRDIVIEDDDPDICN